MEWAGERVMKKGPIGRTKKPERGLGALEVRCNLGWPCPGLRPGLCSGREVAVVVRSRRGVADHAPFVLGEVAVVDVDDSGELGGEELADGLDLLEELRREGGAVVAEEHEDGEALAVVPARKPTTWESLSQSASEPRYSSSASGVVSVAMPRHP